MLGHEGSSRGPTTSRLKQLQEQERRQTLTQNLKAMGLWVLLLITCSTFTFSIRCGTYNSHLHTTTHTYDTTYMNII